IFFLNEGFRVIAHDRRGHGRSTQTDSGNDMDTYASDVEELVEHLDLLHAVHIGHSTGGGEVAHYVARAKPGRVDKAVLIGAVPPLMLKTESNPAVLRSKRSTLIARGSPPTARKSTSISPLALSTVSTVPACS